MAPSSLKEELQHIYQNKEYNKASETDVTDNAVYSNLHHSHKHKHNNLHNNPYFKLICSQGMFINLSYQQHDELLSP